ncbi:two-component sensor histidine kinase [Halomonas cupida]|uniref:histidine kinase n=1 Tax=Halomonas cupida TaxID=44933 RepID=A0A1M7CN86_9GAMM|nr:HAMP domain-containing sensor histidine kinase [Halomonas cupida]GEN26033.1 two-component sensor histidine kinase [Halomonas cupida]SHL68758.1 Signal transduction histidine kinase [Halomonas cupida]
MKRFSVPRLFRSLYARIAFIYLTSLVIMSLAAAWVAVAQFDQLGREWLQRSQLDLAQQLATVMQEPLTHGANSAQAQAAAERIFNINPSVTLYAVDLDGKVVAAWSTRDCGEGAVIETAPIRQILSETPMLPVYATMPCAGGENVFSAAHVTFGADQQPGYLLVSLEANAHLTMVGMWQTSSIMRSMLFAGAGALVLSAGAGLLLFALMTRRFSQLTHAVQRFAQGDYRKRIPADIDDEIGQAGRAFNDMAATIEAQLEALRVNDSQRRELIANLSHDFRTPLTSVQGYAQQLRQAPDLSDTRSQKMVESILSNVDRLARLANQLSQLSRFDVSDRPLAVEAFSLTELAYDIVGKFQPHADATGVALSVDSSIGLQQITADLELIDRAITNLVDNALSATGEGGAVTIELRAHDAGIEVSVIDTGVGLSSEEITLVVQRFYRTEGSRSRGEGSGLGLSIVTEILARHRSRLELTSRPGKGTRARFVLNDVIDTV